MYISEYYVIQKCVFAGRQTDVIPQTKPELCCSQYRDLSRCLHIRCSDGLSRTWRNPFDHQASKSGSVYSRGPTRPDAWCPESGSLRSDIRRCVNPDSEGHLGIVSSLLHVFAFHRAGDCCQPGTESCFKSPVRD